VNTRHLGPRPDEVGTWNSRGGLVDRPDPGSGGGTGDSHPLQLAECFDDGLASFAKIQDRPQVIWGQVYTIYYSAIASGVRAFAGFRGVRAAFFMESVSPGRRQESVNAAVRAGKVEARLCLRAREPAAGKSLRDSACPSLS
jgi:hypothetical protein